MKIYQDNFLRITKLFRHKKLLKKPLVRNLNRTRLFYVRMSTSFFLPRRSFKLKVVGMVKKISEIPEFSFPEKNNSKYFRKNSKKKFRNNF